MAKITTPVKGFTGSVVGVSFKDGTGSTDDPTALAYFARQGYGIEQSDTPVEIPDGKPSTDWKGDQLKAYAGQHEIDLGSAKSKAEIVEAIETATGSDENGDEQPTGSDEKPTE